MTMMTIASNNLTWSMHGYCVSLCRHVTNIYGLMSCQLLFPTLRVFPAWSLFADAILIHNVSHVTGNKLAWNDSTNFGYDVV